jgi:hypothetical protein
MWIFTVIPQPYLDITEFTQVGTVDHTLKPTCFSQDYTVHVGATPADALSTYDASFARHGFTGDIITPHVTLPVAHS